MRLLLIALTLVLIARVACAVPTVFVYPDSLQVEPQQDFSLSIRIDAAVDTVCCYLVEFEFDASVLELVAAEEGSLFAHCGQPTMFNWDVITNGRHSCNDVILGYLTYVLTPGELVRCDFRARRLGQSPVELTVVDVRDIRREAILPLNSAGAIVRVGHGTGVPDVDEQISPEWFLRASPNPFSSETRIGFEIPGAIGEPRLTIYNLSGRVVARPRITGAGSDDGVGWAHWRGASGPALLPSGTYFIGLSCGNRVLRERVTLTR